MTNPIQIYQDWTLDKWLHVSCCHKVLHVYNC